MNQSKFFIPWRFMLTIAAIIGFFWPFSYVIASWAALLYTVMVAVAAGVFVFTLLPTGQALPFGQYFGISFVVGLMAQIVAWITIPLIWCQLFTHSDFCTYPHYGGPLFPFALISFGLYLFLLVMIYMLLK